MAEKPLTFLIWEGPLTPYPTLPLPLINKNKRQENPLTSCFLQCLALSLSTYISSICVIKCSPPTINDPSLIYKVAMPISFNVLSISPLPINFPPLTQSISLNPIFSSFHSPPLSAFLRHDHRLHFTVGPPSCLQAIFPS